MVVFYASTPSYFNHLHPLWSKQPSDLKKYPFFAIDDAYETAIQHLGRDSVLHSLPPPKVPAIVAGYSDYQRVGGGREVALVEHGAGQTYTKKERYTRYPADIPDRNPSNPGGIDRGGFKLFLCPNQRVADLNLASYPSIPSVVVGSPWVDYLTDISNAQPRKRGQKPLMPPPPVVGLTFHWNNNQSPLSGSALDYYKPILTKLARTHHVIGTAHPRWYRQVSDYYRSIGIDSTPHFEQIIRSASLLLVDNSSAGPEFMAATSKPVIWLNCPSYDPSLTAPPRFWDWTIDQPSCDSPDDLIDLVSKVHYDPDSQSDRREEIVNSLYAHRGEAVERSWRAIKTLLLSQVEFE